MYAVHGVQLCVCVYWEGRVKRNRKYIDPQIK